MFIYTCFTLCPQCVAVSGTQASVLNPNFGPQVVPVYPQPSSSMVRDSLPQWLEAEIAGLKWRFVFWDFAIVHHSPQLAVVHEAIWLVTGSTGGAHVASWRSWCLWRQEREGSPSEEVSGKLCSLFQDLNGELFVVWPESILTSILGEPGFTLDEFGSCFLESTEVQNETGCEILFGLARGLVVGVSWDV